MLDNAANVAQVRPLLPGTGSCLVVVTSRDSLAGLVAVDGAHRLDLDLLAPAEAVSLLCRLIGARVEAEPEAAATLLCYLHHLSLVGHSVPACDQGVWCGPTQSARRGPVQPSQRRLARGERPSAPAGCCR
ncbi:hypothetical protein AAH979_31955 [Plantactinospora sp. ZYX-F-223]|uniref:hypothetical protein n=1 Tax=Plantactinospora sp. ZYX-F-223 TaxID=3144103 RepID=UPI0031FD938C